MESTLGVKYDLILALRSQIFESLGETFRRYALEYLQPARSENKGKKCCRMETPDHCWPFWRPVVGGDTSSPLAPVLDPEQKR